MEIYEDHRAPQLAILEESKAAVYGMIAVSCSFMGGFLFIFYNIQ